MAAFDPSPKLWRHCRQVNRPPSVSISQRPSEIVRWPPGASPSNRMPKLAHIELRHIAQLTLASNSGR